MVTHNDILRYTFKIKTKLIQERKILKLTDIFHHDILKFIQLPMDPRYGVKVF